MSARQRQSIWDPLHRLAPISGAVGPECEGCRTHKERGEFSVGQNRRVLVLLMRCCCGYSADGESRSRQNTRPLLHRAQKCERITAAAGGRRVYLRTDRPEIARWADTTGVIQPNSWAIVPAGGRCCQRNLWRIKWQSALSLPAVADQLHQSSTAPMRRSRRLAQVGCALVDRGIYCHHKGQTFVVAGFCQIAPDGTMGWFGKALQARVAGPGSCPEAELSVHKHVFSRRVDTGRRWVPKYVHLMMRRLSSSSNYR